MCKKCGCNTCESIRGPLLTEGRVKKLVSENLQYHINENIPLMESVFRIGSDAHLSVIKEARKLYSRGVLDLCEEDKGIIETHLGEFDLYEDKIVPLDLPMLNEFDDKSIKAYGNAVKKAYGVKVGDILTKDGKKGKVVKVMDDMANVDFGNGDVYGITFGRIKGKEIVNEDKTEDLLQQIRDTLYTMLKGDNEREQDIENLDISIDDLIGNLTGKSRVDVGVDQLDFDKFTKPNKIKEAVKLALTERKKKKKKTKKDPPIGKPKRGGSKAYYVYVRDPKTKKVKKVSFGSGGLRAKIRNPKARNAFAKRHICKEKTDRTKPGYWSCRLPRYASQLGLGANMNTFW